MKKITGLILCLLLILLIPLEVTAAESVPKDVMEASKSVVRILAEYSDGYATGSGFVIKNEKDSALIVTNHHVIEDSPYSISIWVSEDEMANAQILIDEEEKDLCILKVNTSIPMRALHLSHSGAKKGDAVYAVGFPGAADYLSDTEAHTSQDATITDGIVSALRSTKIVSYGELTSILQISSPINSGNSGGPLFNTKGEVIGINTYGISESQGIFGAIDVSELITLLSNNKIPLSKSFSINLTPIILIIIILIFCILVIFLIITHRISPKKVVILSIFILCSSLILYCGIGQIMTYHYAKIGNPEMVVRYNYLPYVTKVLNPNLFAFSQACDDLISHNYLEARDQFIELNSYLSSKNMINEATYRQAATYLEKGQYDQAARMYKRLANADYRDSKSHYLDTQRRWIYYLIKQDRLLKAHEIFISFEDTNGLETVIQDLNSALYVKGQQLYRSGNYDESNKYFKKIPLYLDSSKYNLLLDTRLRKIDTETIKKITSILDFEDAATVLVSNNQIAQLFLEGEWKTTDYTYYFIVKSEQRKSNGSITDEYLISRDGPQVLRTYSTLYNIPHVKYGDYYSFEDGTYMMYPEEQESAARKLFDFTVIDQDCIDVYSYKSNLTYRMYRQ